MKKILYLLFFLCPLTFAQQLMIVNQNGDKIDCPLEIEISLPKEMVFKWPDTNTYLVNKIVNNDDVVKIHIKDCRCVKEYYNEFKPANFSLMDSIELYEDCKMKEYTPRILFNDFDSWVKDTIDYTWFSTYLKEINFLDSDKLIEITIQSSNKNASCRKTKITKYSRRIAELFEVPEDRLIFKFTNSAYVTRDTDKFIPGQIVDRQFIKSQNTVDMKAYAKQFSVVGVVNIIRNN